MKQALRLIVLLCLIFSQAPADPANSQVKGVLITQSGPEAAAVTTPFSSIVWTSNLGGFVTTDSGAKQIFDSHTVEKIVYFDPLYYNSVNHDMRWVDYRAGVESHEATITIGLKNMVTAGDLKSVQADQAVLQAIVQQYPSAGAVLQPQIDLAGTYIKLYNQDQRYIGGKWLSVDALNARQNHAGKSEFGPLSFTAKNGVHFENSKVSVGDVGLNVLTSEGGTTIPFDQLPDDMSGFPQELQKRIADARVGGTNTVKTPAQ
jgi:hypothetical protein